MYETCILCGKFTRIHRYQSCATCHQADEQILQRAKERVSPECSLTVYDLARQLSIPAERVFLWLQQGRMKSIYFKHLCLVCGGDQLTNQCKCEKPNFGVEADEDKAPPSPVLNRSSRRVEELLRRYSDDIAILRSRNRQDILLPVFES